MKKYKRTKKILLYSFLDFVDFLFLRVVDVLEEGFLDDFFISLIIFGLVGADDVSWGLMLSGLSCIKTDLSSFTFLFDSSELFSDKCKSLLFGCDNFSGLTKGM